MISIYIYIYTRFADCPYPKKEFHEINNTEKIVNERTKERGTEVVERESNQSTWRFLISPGQLRSRVTPLV